MTGVIHWVFFVFVYLVFMLKETKHSVKIVEPLGPLDSSSDTACVRSVISYVMHIPTEKPVTILSK